MKTGQRPYARSKAAVAATVSLGIAATLTAPTAGAAVSRERNAYPMARAADIRPGPLGSAPHDITAFAGGVVFAADDGTHGTRLWRSDGTPGGTRLVSSSADLSAASSELVVAGDWLYFSAQDQLWRSDGTEAGTQQVVDLNPGGGADTPLEQLTAVGGTVFFTAADAVSGRELWRSDGTAAGTVKLTDRPPGADPKPVDNLTAVGSTLWFTAGDGTANVTELWRSDGTPAGTATVTKTNGTDDGYPGLITGAGGSTYFAWGVGSDGRDVYRAGGSGSTIETVFDGGQVYVQDLEASGATLYISNHDGENRLDEIWLSDGTQAGSRRVSVLPAGPATYPGSRVIDLTMVGDTVFFTHVDAVRGRELWRSDGTTSGTKRLTSLHGTTPEGGPTELVASGDALYFVARGNKYGRELWTSDGTVRGTRPVADARPGRASSDPTGLTDVDGRLFLSLDDGVTGQELWTTLRDRAVAKLRVRGQREQRQSRPKVGVRVKVGAGERVTTLARGRVHIPGARKAVVLKRARVITESGRTRTFRLLVPSASRAAVMRAVHRHRRASGPAGARLVVRAKVTVRVQDGAGNTVKKSRTIRLT